MTDKEKLKEIKKLADAIYYAAQYLTTDASRLHKAMDEYHQFIIHEWREEPVSDECIYNRTLEERQRSCKFCSAACQVRIKEESVSEGLEEEIGRYFKENGNKWAYVDVARHFANWQKQQDQSTIELAEDHAMLAGMEKMKEQMMAKAVDGDITFDYYGDGDKTYGCIAHDSFCLEDFGLKDRDKVKVVVIKKD